MPTAGKTMTDGTVTGLVDAATVVKEANEKRAAADRVSPNARPAVIVTPERDVPGISDSACAQPIITASRQPTLYSSRCWRPACC